MLNKNNNYSLKYIYVKVFELEEQKISKKREKPPI